MPVDKDARETARQIMQWGYYEYRSDNFEEHLSKAEQLIHAREEAVQQHIKVSYSPYVDMFQMVDVCALTMKNDELLKYKATKEIEFWTSKKDGHILLMNIDHPHDDAELQSQLKENKEAFGMKMETDQKVPGNSVRFDHPDGRSEGFILGNHPDNKEE